MVMALIAYAGFGIAPLSDEIIFWGILSGILHGVYILCLSRAYSTADISYVYPIARSAPVFVPVFAWLFLDEHLSIFTFLAIGLILTAIYILHFEGQLIQGFKNLIKAVRDQDLRWAFITLAMVVSYSLVDKKGMDSFLGHLPDQPFLPFLSPGLQNIFCRVFREKVHIAESKTYRRFDEKEGDPVDEGLIRQMT